VGEEYRSWNSSLWSFHFNPIIWRQFETQYIISQLRRSIFFPTNASKVTFPSLLPHFHPARLERHSFVMPQITYCFL
jgi:hypothetical protein